MADASKSLSPVPAGPGGSIADSSGILEVPLWQVRLRLAWRSIRTNVALFAENPIGLVGLSIIVFFAIMAFIHPILLQTVWDPNMYNPITGYDISIPFHPSPPSATHLLGTDPLRPGRPQPIDVWHPHGLYPGHGRCPGHHPDRHNCRRCLSLLRRRRGYPFHAPGLT
jgi:hypothetical protein